METHADFVKFANNMGEFCNINEAYDICMFAKEQHKELNELNKELKIDIENLSPCPNCRGCKLQKATELTQYKFFFYIELLSKSVAYKNKKLYSSLSKKIDDISFETLNKYDELIKEYPEIYKEEDYIHSCNQLGRNTKQIKAFITHVNSLKKHIFTRLKKTA
jgi:hypothetical protein